jgi:hypothetical protein
MWRGDFAEAYQEQVHNLASKHEWREREWPVMAPNSALLTDAFHSALRAPVGAAKRERYAAS